MQDDYRFKDSAAEMYPFAIFVEYLETFCVSSKFFKWLYSSLVGVTSECKNCSIVIVGLVNPTVILDFLWMLFPLSSVVEMLSTLFFEPRIQNLEIWQMLIRSLE